MHLALFISSLNSGGSQRALSELACHWALEGHQVSLVTLAPQEAKSFYPLHSRIKVIQLNQSWVTTSLFTRLVSILMRLFSLRKIIRNLNPDVVVSFVDIMNITVLIASWGLKVPVIVSERTHPAFHQLSKLHQILRTLLYPKASHVVMQTESSATYFKKFSNLKIIPNAVRSPPITKEFIEEKIQQIVSVGRLCPVKGFDILIHAFSNIIRDYPDLVLKIYGEGEDRLKLERLINSLGLQGKAFLLGTTSNIYEALVKADVFIFPSHYEGFPNALCEAMAVGLPVIASNCSGNVDIIREGIDGRLFPIGNIEALTQIIHELLNDSEQLRRLSKNARKICDRFYPGDIFQRWDNLILNANVS